MDMLTVHTTNIMMVYAYEHGITEFGENEPSVQKSVFKRLRH